MLRQFIGRLIIMMGAFGLAILIMLGAGGIRAAEAQPTIVKVGTGGMEDQQQYVIAKWAKEYIEEKSNGRYKLEIFCCNKLGSEEATFSQMKMGSIQMAVLSSPGYADPMMNITCCPFLYRGRDHFYKVFQGPIGKEISETFESRTGVLPIIYSYRIHQMIFTSKPLIKPEDWKKFKIRAATAPCWMSQITGIGGNTVPLPFTEVYMGLKTGIVDGVQTVLDAFYAFKFYEVCKYAIDIKHDWSPWVTLINAKFLKNLPSADQKIFIEAFTSQKEMNQKWVDEKISFYTDAIKKEGVELYVAPEKDLELYRKKFNDWMGGHCDLFGGKEIYEKVRDLK